MPRVHGIELHRKHGRRRRPNHFTGGAGIGNNHDGGGIMLSSSTSSPALAPESASVSASASASASASPLPSTTANTGEQCAVHGSEALKRNNDDDAISLDRGKIIMNEDRNDSNTSSSGISGKHTTGLDASHRDQTFNSKSPLPEKVSTLKTTPTATSATIGKTRISTNHANSTFNDNDTPNITTPVGRIRPQSKEVLDNLEFSSNSFSVATISHRAASSIAASNAAAAAAAVTMDTGGYDTGIEVIANDTHAGILKDSQLAYSASDLHSSGRGHLEEVVEKMRRQNQQQRDGQIRLENGENSGKISNSLSPNLSHPGSDDDGDNINNDNDNDNNDGDDDEDWENLPLENMVDFLRRALSIGGKGNQNGKRGKGGREHCTHNHGNANENNDNNSEEYNSSDNNRNVSHHESRKSFHDHCSGGSDDGNATNKFHANDEKSVSVDHGEEGSNASRSIGNSIRRRSDGKVTCHLSEEKFNAESLAASQALSTLGTDDSGIKSSSDQRDDTTPGKRNVVTPHVSKSKASLSISPDDTANESAETPEHEQQKDDDSTPRHSNIPQPSEFETQFTKPALEKVPLASSWKKPRSRHKKRMKNIKETWKGAGTDGHNNITTLDPTTVDKMQLSSTLDSQHNEREDNIIIVDEVYKNGIKEASIPLIQNTTERDSNEMPAQDPCIAENAAVRYNNQRALDGSIAIESSESSPPTEPNRDSSPTRLKKTEKIVSPRTSISCDGNKHSASNKAGEKISSGREENEVNHNVELQPSDINIGDTEDRRITIKKLKPISTEKQVIELEKEVQTTKTSNSSPSNWSSSRPRQKQQEKSRTSGESNRLKEGNRNKKEFARSPKQSNKNIGYDHDDMTDREPALAESPNRDNHLETEQNSAVPTHDSIDLMPVKVSSGIGAQEVIDLTNDENQHYNQSAKSNQDSDDSEVWHDAKEEMSMENTHDIDNTNGTVLRMKSKTEQPSVHKLKRKRSTARIMFTGITPTTRYRRVSDIRAEHFNPQPFYFCRLTFFSYR